MVEVWFRVENDVCNGNIAFNCVHVTYLCRSESEKQLQLQELKLPVHVIRASRPYVRIKGDCEISRMLSNMADALVIT